MTSKSKITLAAVLFAAFATPALAASDEWLVDGGHYVNGQVPSYTEQAPLHATRAPRLLEGRNAAVIGNFGTFSGTQSGRDALVQSPGN